VPRSGGGPGAVAVVRGAEAGGQGIQEEVARPDVPRDAPTIRGGHADVREAAEVEAGRNVGEEEGVGDGNERRALATRRHIQRAEVAHHRHAAERVVEVGA
jgi:hypothetical protein